MKPGDGCTYTEAIRDRCTYTEAIRDRRCYQCGAQPAGGVAGETVPYCVDCRRKHVNMQRKRGHE